MCSVALAASATVALELGAVSAGSWSLGAKILAASVRQLNSSISSTARARATASELPQGELIFVAFVLALGWTLPPSCTNALRPRTELARRCQAFTTKEAGVSNDKRTHSLSLSLSLLLLSASVGDPCGLALSLFNTWLILLGYCLLMQLSAIRA